MKNGISRKTYEVKQDPEIIDDFGLIQCINRLNALREKDGEIGSDVKEVLVEQERDVLTKINRISAEMRWFSQWLTVKAKSAA